MMYGAEIILSPKICGKPSLMRRKVGLQVCEERSFIHLTGTLFLCGLIVCENGAVDKATVDFALHDLRRTFAEDQAVTYALDRALPAEKV